MRTDWHIAFFCVDCETEIDSPSLHGGVCPSCGYVSKGTVCSTYVRSRRWVVGKDYRWWNPFTWSNGRWQYRMTNNYTSVKE